MSYTSDLYRKSIEEEPVVTESIEEPVVTEPIEEPVVTESIEEPVVTESLLEKLGVEKTKLNSDNVDILFIASHIPQFIQMLEKASTITVIINSDSITFNLDNNEVTISKTNWALNGETHPICFNASWFLKQDDSTAKVLHNNIHAAERFANFIREIAKTNATLTDYVGTTLGDIDNDTFVVYRKGLPCAVFYKDHEGRKVKLVA